MMENDLKFGLILSLIVHLSLFLFFSFQSKKIVYVNLPVELFFYTTPESQEKLQKEATKKEEEIIIPKKIKKKTKKKKKEKKVVEKNEEKEAPKPEPKQLSPSSQINIDAAKFPYTYYTKMIVREKVDFKLSLYYK